MRRAAVGPTIEIPASSATRSPSAVAVAKQTDLDAFGHVNHATFLTYLEET